ncbi:MAG: helix-turn-helix domain-containing protein [Tannerellaceae bacterium]|nr:helix-turn-helix domain-containing protein [Tannerellaceae bacterium]
MLTAEEIKSIARSGEGYNADFKISVPSKVRELSQDVCAFANSEGGYILIGIDNKNQIAGATINNTKRSAIQDAIRDISPVINVNTYSVDVEGKTIWVMDVPSGKDKPYVTSGAIYVREGTNTQKLTTAEEIRAFFQSSNRIYFDAVPCPQFKIDEELDKKNLKQFLLVSSISGNVSTQQILNNLQTFNESGVIKNGGVLFFGQQPESFFPQAIVRCVRFKGTTKVHIIDDKIYGGSLYQQYIQAEAWVKDKLEVAYIIEGTGPRKEIWEIPLTVFKEAIINALSHRDYYEQGAVTMIEVYDDRVEISNPGGLLPGVKNDFGKKSMTRNPLIFGLFTRMNLVERVASGIPRMRGEMQDAGLPAPIFSTDGGFFTVEFRRPKRDDIVNPDNGIVNVIVNDKDAIKQTVLRLITEKEGLSASDIAKLIDRSWRTTMRYLNLLKKENKIEFRGAPKTGGYYLKTREVNNYTGHTSI